MQQIDLRSDTVTRPSAGMRAAIANAEVGDDVYGEDPVALALQARVAALLGKESALFVPSGTMSNQLALQTQTRPGDHVLVGEGAHCERFETGAAAALAGVQLGVVGSGGTFTADEMLAAINPLADYAPRTSLVCVENTHNMAGGRIFHQPDVDAICKQAHLAGLRVHLDGARLWNAAVATDKSLEELAAGADTVSVCFSKGLGAPIGSALAGDAATIGEARRYRKMYGGGMRQVGILAAAALYALDHHFEELGRDHALASQIGNALSELDGVSVGPIETNIVMVTLDRPVAQNVVEAAQSRGVLLYAMGPAMMRLVTHRDVGNDDITVATDALVAAIRSVISDDPQLRGEQ
jgi:threonine aldolase